MDDAVLAIEQDFGIDQVEGKTEFDTKRCAAVEQAARFLGHRFLGAVIFVAGETQQLAYSRIRQEMSMSRRGRLENLADFETA